MIPKAVRVAMVCCCLFAPRADAQTRRDPWRKDPLFQRLAARLDRVPAIDMHTHLLEPGAFDPNLANAGPLMLRASQPWFVAAVRARFGVSIQPDRLPAANAAILAAREKMIERLGTHGYWMDHLDYTVTDIAFVNQSVRDGTDGKRLRWVPNASTLLYPLPAEHLMERSPAHRTGIAGVQERLTGLLGKVELREAPRDLAGYVRFIDAVLRRWQTDTAVAVKFWDAYLRTLRIADVDEQRAAALYAKGRDTPLSRDEYLAVQDYLWRHILLEAGTLKLPSRREAQRLGRHLLAGVPVSGPGSCRAPSDAPAQRTGKGALWHGRRQLPERSRWRRRPAPRALADHPRCSVRRALRADPGRRHRRGSSGRAGTRCAA
jgi:hypothetical protein